MAGEYWSTVFWASVIAFSPGLFLMILVLAPICPLTELISERTLANSDSCSLVFSVTLFNSSNLF
jgi:hypothetical protein